MNRAWPDTGLTQGCLPCSGSVGSISGDRPCGIEDLACAHCSPAGSPVCCCQGAGREDGRVGGIFLRAICLDMRSRWLWDRRGRPWGKSPRPPSLVPLVALPLPLKTILRSITFIMSFIMGDSSSCLKINAGIQNYIWYMEVFCI